MRRRPTRSRRALSRVFSALVAAVLVAVTGAAVLFLAPSLLGYERYVITGGSMSGSIEKGSVVFEDRVPVEDLAVGDVITYLPPADSGVTNLVTHRIVDVTEGTQRTFRTQGDANPDPDPWTFSLAEGTQPVVRYSVPWVGHAVLALADRDTRMIVVGAPAAAIALLSLLELAGALRGEAGDARRRREVSAPAGPASAPTPTPTPTPTPAPAPPPGLSVTPVTILTGAGEYVAA